MSKIVWDGGRGREAVGMDAASAETQRAASKQIAARASLSRRSGFTGRRGRI